MVVLKAVLFALVAISLQHTEASPCLLSGILKGQAKKTLEKLQDFGEFLSTTQSDVPAPTVSYEAEVKVVPKVADRAGVKSDVNQLAEYDRDALAEAAKAGLLTWEQAFAMSQGVWAAAVKNGKQDLEDMKLTADLLKVTIKTKSALEAAVEKGQLTNDQANDILAVILRDVKDKKLNGLIQLDVALQQLVKERVIDGQTKDKILLSAIRAGAYKSNPTSLKDGIAAAVKIAIQAGDITTKTGELIKKRSPESVEIDVRGKSSNVPRGADVLAIRKDVHELAEYNRDALSEAAKSGILTWQQAFEMSQAVWAAAVKDSKEDLENMKITAGLIKIAIKTKSALNEAVKNGQLTNDEANQVMEVVKRDVKDKKLSGLTKIYIALQQLVNEKVIDEQTKNKILISFIRTGSYKNNPASLKDGIAAAVKIAVDAGSISKQTGEIIKKRAPESVEIDVRGSAQTEVAEQESVEVETPGRTNVEIIDEESAEVEIPDRSNVEIMDEESVEVDIPGRTDVEIIDEESVEVDIPGRTDVEIVDEEFVEVDIPGSSNVEIMDEISVEVDVPGKTNVEIVEKVVSKDADPAGVRDDVRQLAEYNQDALTKSAKAGVLTWQQAFEMSQAVWDAAAKNRKEDLEDMKVTAGLLNIAIKTKNALDSAVTSGHLANDEANKVMEVVKRDVKDKKLSGLIQIYIALDQMVKDKLIQGETRDFILLSAIRAGAYKSNPASLKEELAAAVQAAVEAGDITKQAGEVIKMKAPESVDIEVRSKSKEVPRGADELAIRTDIYELAQYNRNALTEAAKAGLLTWQQAFIMGQGVLAAAAKNSKEDLLKMKMTANLIYVAIKTKSVLEAAVEKGQLTSEEASEVMEVVKRDVIDRKLSGLIQVDIALQELVKDKVIDGQTKEKIVISFIRAGAYKSNAASLKDSIAAAVKIAVEAGHITMQTGEIIKFRAAESVEVDVDA